MKMKKKIEFSGLKYSCLASLLQEIKNSGLTEENYKDIEFELDEKGLRIYKVDVDPSAGTKAARNLIENVSNTFTYDENAKIMYINGTIPFAGTLYINYIATTNEIDVDDSTTNIWTEFLPRFIPVLGFYAIGIHMGAVDYDQVTARMAPNNLSAMTAIKNAMETWDNKRQQSAIENNDPGELYNFPRSGAIDRTGSPTQ
jgi:hypothetical protein